MEVVDAADEWLLVERDGELEAVHPVPFDGARYCSTRERTVAAGKTSEYGLTADGVQMPYADGERLTPAEQERVR